MAHYGPYKSNTSQKVICRTLQKRLERFETGNRRISPSCVDWAWFGRAISNLFLREHFILDFESWGNIVVHFLDKIVGQKPDENNIRDPRE